VLHRSSAEGELLHIDIGGGGKLPRALGSQARYWLAAIDDYSGWCTVKFLREKSSAKHALKEIITEYERDRQVQVRQIHSLADIVEPGTIPELPEANQLPPRRDTIVGIQSDRGGEFIDAQLQQWAKDSGIKWVFSAAYAHEQNGKVERLMRILGERTRAVLKDSSLPAFLWAEIMRAVAFLRNLIPYHGRKVDGSKSPYELRYGRKPDLSFLSILGSDAYVVRHQEEIRRNPLGRHLADRAWIGKLIGYSSYHGALYRIFRPYRDGRPGGTIHEVRDVIIDEGSDFDLYANPDLPDLQQTNTDNPTRQKVEAEQAYDTEASAAESQDAAEDHDTTSDTESDTESINSEVSDQSTSASSIGDETTAVYATIAPKAVQYATTPRADRQRIESLVLATTIQKSPSKNQLTAGAAVEDLPDLPPLPLLQSVDPKWLESPQTLAEAQASPFWPWWWRAMCAEKKQLEILSVWKAIRPPKNTKILSGKWVFKLKMNASGEPARFKARWVARGFMQEEGVDYHETFAGTGRYETLRVLLVAILLLRLYTAHVDVNLAYLNAVLKEQIYVDYPYGFEDEAPGQACLLQRSLYGLKQSAYNWYLTLGNLLIKRGFQRSAADPCLYTLRTNQGVAFIFVYVDDMLIAASSEDLLNRCKRYVSAQWSITDLGPVSHYLGLKIEHDRERGRLRISQRAYIEKITAAIAGDVSRQAPSTPISEEPGAAAEGHQATKSAIKTYQSAVGSLMHTMNVSRPDLAYPLSVLSRFLTNPTDEHLREVKRAAAYLSHSSNLAIEYRIDSTDNSKEKDGDLKGYVDASYAGCPDTRRSRSGYIFYLAGGPVAWSSQQQKCTAKSSTEAEYLAYSEAGSEAIWLQRLIRDLGIQKDEEPAVLYTDSEPAIAIAENRKAHTKSRHIEVRWHWIREQIQERKISLRHTPGSTLVADGLTKALTKTKHAEFIDRLRFYRL
jgi:transposase InsO family protein